MIDGELSVIKSSINLSVPATQVASEKSRQGTEFQFVLTPMTYTPSCNPLLFKVSLQSVALITTVTSFQTTNGNGEQISTTSPIVYYINIVQEKSESSGNLIVGLMYLGIFGAVFLCCGLVGLRRR